MADDIVDDGQGSYLSRAATTLQGSSSVARSNGQQTTQPRNTANPDRQNGSSTSTRPGVVQPTPQVVGARKKGPTHILVSPRQKGNPVLDKIKNLPWEYSDIAADYVVGLTTCALFLSLKYHRLHPEYIYTRIKNLQGKYNLRIVLCMVDIDNHEDSLKELSKTSVINNVTIILCWSAAECARYLELFKQCENAAPTSIKQHQSEKYGDRMVEFVTTPRAINKTDAVSLVSQFGTLRTAVNARHEEVSTIAGWGEKKVSQWCDTVREPFRVKQAGKRGLNLENLVASQPVSRAPTLSRDVTRGEGETPAGASPVSNGSRPTTSTADADKRQPSRLAEEESITPDEEALAEMTTQLRPASKPAVPKPVEEPAQKRKANDDPLSDGLQAALNKLRQA